MVSYMGGVGPFSPLAQVQPFSYRDNATYLTILEQLRLNLDDMVSAFNSNASAQDTENTALQTAINEAITQVNQAVTDANNAETSAANSAALVGAPAKSVIDTILGGDSTNLVPDLATTNANVATTNQNLTDLDNRSVKKGDLVVRVVDYASPQAAIDAAPAGGVVLFPPGDTEITTPLVVTKALTLAGYGLLNSKITANGCDGIHLAVGLTQVAVKGLRVVCPVPHTSTPNTFIGILVDGNDTAHPGYDLFEDVWVEGFQTSIQTRSMNSSRLERVYTAYCQYGIDAFGLSENNVVHAAQLTVGSATTRLQDSASIRLNGHASPSDMTSDQSEGWIITDSILFNGDYGVLGKGYSSYQIRGNIIDFIHVAGVAIMNDGSGAWGGAVTVTDNYVAMATDTDGPEGAIDLSGTVLPAMGTRISGNQIRAYGSQAPYGIRLIANIAEQTTIILGNTLGGFATCDIKLQCSGTIVANNMCESNVANHIYTDAGQFNMVEGNLSNSGTAKVFVDDTQGFPNQYTVDSAGKRIMRGHGAPTNPSTGLSWAVGDRVVNVAPAVGQPKAWVCTVAGAPGTWVSEGNL